MEMLSALIGAITQDENTDHYTVTSKKNRKHSSSTYHMLSYVTCTSIFTNVLSLIIHDYLLAYWFGNECIETEPVLPDTEPPHRVGPKQRTDLLPDSAGCPPSGSSSGDPTGLLLYSLTKLPWAQGHQAGKKGPSL